MIYRLHFTFLHFVRRAMFYMASFLPFRCALTKLVLLLSMALCARGVAAETEKLAVLASIRPLSLLVQDLTQGLPVEVATLLPANADPHNWSMRMSDRTRLQNANLIVWLGPDFENFLAKTLHSHKSLAHLQLGDLPALQWPEEHHDHHEHDHHGHGHDMHLWLNPANAMEIHQALAEKIVQLRPDWKQTVQHNLQQQIAQLEKLRADIQQRLSAHSQHSFIAYHDAYGHFVAAFDLHQLNAVNQSSEQRLSAKALHQLQNQARNARCLMAEKNAEQEQRLAKILNLPMVVADGLATDAKLQTYADFLTGIAAAFETCLAGSE